MKSNRVLFVCLSGLLLLAAESSRALLVTNEVTVDTVWTAADSPVTVEPYTFRVREPAVLTIESGVTVRVMSRFEVEGTLRVLGSEQSRVVFEGVSGSWGPLYFRQDSQTSLSTNRLEFCDLTAMDSYIYVSQQTLLMSNCVMASTGVFSYALAAYVNSGSGQPSAAARVEVHDSRFDLETYDDSLSGHIQAFIMDGMESVFRNNVICLRATNDIATLHGLRFYVSNTEPFNGHVEGNEITVIADGGGGVLNMYGISYDSKSSGQIISNRVLVSGPQTITGIANYGTNLMLGNEVSMMSTSGVSFGYVYGLRSENTGGNEVDMLVNNTVRVVADRDGRYLYGIYCQRGRVRGNRVMAEHRGGSGSLAGITQIYYDGLIEGNTVVVNATGMVAQAVLVGTHYNSNNVVEVRNNILCAGEDGGHGYGLVKDGGCDAMVSNRYNLIYGFATGYVNCAAGPGAQSGDPQFADTNLLPAAGSPVIDAGVNAVWMDSAQDARGYPRIDNAVVDIGAVEYYHLPVADGYYVVNGGVETYWVVPTGAVCRLQHAGTLMDAAWSESAVVTATTERVQFDLTDSTGCHYYRVSRDLP